MQERRLLLEVIESEQRKTNNLIKSQPLSPPQQDDSPLLAPSTRFYKTKSSFL